MGPEGKWVIGIAVVVILIFGGLMYSYGQKAPAGTGDTTPADPSVLVRSDSHATAPGAQGAPVTVVEFGDYQCPACGAVHPIVKAALEQYAGKVNFVFRNFPLPMHPHAVVSAQAAEIAGDQGKFWEMHDMIYEHQDAWSNTKDPKPVFISYAKDLGMDVAVFTASLTANKYADKIKRDQDDGNTLRVSQTPTFYVNGKQLLLKAPNDLINAIAAALGNTEKTDPATSTPATSTSTAE